MVMLRQGDRSPQPDTTSASCALLSLLTAFSCHDPQVSGNPARMNASNPPNRPTQMSRYSGHLDRLEGPGAAERHRTSSERYYSGTTSSVRGWDFPATSGRGLSGAGSPSTFCSPASAGHQTESSSGKCMTCSFSPGLGSQSSRSRPRSPDTVRRTPTFAAARLVPS